MVVMGGKGASLGGSAAEMEDKFLERTGTSMSVPVDNHGSLGHQMNKYSGRGGTSVEMRCKFKDIPPKVDSCICW